MSEQPDRTARTITSDETAAPRESTLDEMPPSNRIDDGKDRAIDRRIVTVQRLTGAITTAIFSLVLLGGAVTAMVASSPTRIQALLWLGLWLGITAVIGLFALIWPPVRYRYISYRLDGNGIQIRKGVLWKSTVNVPHSRVQHTDVQQGPIERGYDLATLLIHTAGTQHAVIPLSGLAHEVALAIRDYLLQEGERRAEDG